MSDLPQPVTAQEIYLHDMAQSLRGLLAAITAVPAKEATGEIDLREMGTPLPGDFPGYEALVVAGITTLEAVPNDGDMLVGIKGIGKATVNQILLRLMGK